MTAAAQSDPFGLVGTTLDGQYRVDRVVGEGGFGVVYRGFHHALEQPIAIKALKVIEAEDAQLQEAIYAKFKDEAKLLYTLSQSSLHIVRSIDFGAVRSPSGLWAPYMILEWLEGRSLAEDLDDRRRRGLRGRSVEDALRILEPAAEGLGVAHERRVAHRDVKPANVFLLGGASSVGVKVLDFGIAKVLRETDGAGTKSKFASFTWAYAAPEQMDPRLGATGLATDVYAFALVLTELLTDRPPIEAQDVISMMKTATDPAVRPTPRSRGANVPEAIEAACRRALAVDPRERFGTIREMWSALTAARARPVTLAAPSSGAPLMPQAPAQAHAYASARPPSQAPAQAQHSSVARVSVGAQPVAPPMPPRAPYVVTPPPQAPPTAPRFSGPIAPYGQAPYTGPAPQAWWMRPRMRPTAGSSWPLVATILALILGGLFVVTCAAAHAACG